MSDLELLTEFTENIRSFLREFATRHHAASGRGVVVLSWSRIIEWKARGGSSETDCVAEYATLLDPPADLRADLEAYDPAAECIVVAPLQRPQVFPDAAAPAAFLHGQYVCRLVPFFRPS